MKPRIPLATLALGLTVHAAQAQTGGGDATPRPKNGAVAAMSPVEVLLASASITDPLPFDVPFRLVGEVPAGTTQLDVAYVQTTAILTKRSKCIHAAKKKDRASQERTTALEACAAAFTRDTASLPWVPASQAWLPVGGPPAQPSKFSITVPALNAEQYYRFRFTLSRAATTEQEKAFREAVTPALDALFADINPGVSPQRLTPAELERVWKTSRAELLRAVGPGLTIKQTSIFSNDADWAGVREEFAQAMFTFVITPQTRRNFQLENARRRYAALKPLLDTIVTNEGLDNVLSAAAADAALRKALDGRQASVDLASLDAAAADRVAAGNDAKETVPPAPSLASLRDSVAIAQVATRYTQLRDQLRGLRTLLETLKGPAYKDAIAKAITDKKITPADTALAWSLVKLGDASVVERAAGSAVAAANIAVMLAGETPARIRGIDTIVLRASLVAQDIRFIEATTTGDESTNYSRYVSADAGYAYATGMSTAVPFIGTNIYFRPVNKNAPLSQRGSFGRRFSLTVGIALKSVADADGTRRDLPQLGKSLVFGAGIRVRQSVRLAVGSLLFEKKDPDHPLTTSYEPAFDFLAALSFDIDAASLPAKLGELFK